MTARVDLDVAHVPAQRLSREPEVISNMRDRPSWLGHQSAPAIQQLDRILPRSWHDAGLILPPGKTWHRSLRRAQDGSQERRRAPEVGVSTRRFARESSRPVRPLPAPPPRDTRSLDPAWGRAACSIPWTNPWTNLSTSGSNSNGPKPSKHGTNGVGTTRSFGLWSRRSRVRVPSLTLEVPANRLVYRLGLRESHGPICGGERSRRAAGASNRQQSRASYRRDPWCGNCRCRLVVEALSTRRPRQGNLWWWAWI